MKGIFGEKIWNFLFTLVFISLTIGTWEYIQYKNFNLGNLRFFDFLLMGLATYRVTRLLLYDKVFDFIREPIIKNKADTGFNKSAGYLLTCPWCVSIWMSGFSFTIYVLFPFGKMIIIMLAVAAIASFFHLVISLVGWVSDERKIIAKTTKQNYDEHNKS